MTEHRAAMPWRAKAARAPLFLCDSAAKTRSNTFSIVGLRAHWLPRSSDLDKVGVVFLSVRLSLEVINTAASTATRPDIRSCRRSCNCIYPTCISAGTYFIDISHTRIYAGCVSPIDAR